MGLRHSAAHCVGNASADQPKRAGSNVASYLLGTQIQGGPVARLVSEQPAHRLLALLGEAYWVPAPPSIQAPRWAYQPARSSRDQSRADPDVDVQTLLQRRAMLAIEFWETETP